LFRRESGDGFRLLTDYVMTPYRRWADRDYYLDTLGTTVVLRRRSCSPSPMRPRRPSTPQATWRGQSPPGVERRSSADQSGETDSPDVIPGIAYLGERAPPDSLVELHWDPVADAAGYWVHIYTTLLRRKEKNASGDDAVAIGSPRRWRSAGTA